MMTREETEKYIADLLEKRVVSISDVQLLTRRSGANTDVNLYLMAENESGLQQPRVSAIFGHENPFSNYMWLKHGGKWKVCLGKRECVIEAGLLTKLRNLERITSSVIFMKSFSYYDNAECDYSLLVLIKDVDRDLFGVEKQKIDKAMNEIKMKNPKVVIPPVASLGKRKADLCPMKESKKNKSH